MALINWLTEKEQEWNEYLPFTTIFNPIGDCMDTYIFKGNKTTRIKANNYLHACELFVDRLEKHKLLTIEKEDTYIFIDNLKNQLIPYAIDTESSEKAHASALYVKSLIDRKLLITADKESV